MQTPDPTSRRRSTWAASVRALLRSFLILSCGLWASLPLQPAFAEILAPLEPFKVVEHGSGNTWTYVTLRDGDIGILQLEDVRAGDFTSVVSLLQRHSEWTGVDHDLEFEVLSLSSRDVRFVQLVHGIYVSGHSVFVRFEEDGTVTRLQSAIVHPAAVTDLPSILERDAVEIGKQALRNSLGRSDAEVRMIENPDRIGLEGWDREPTLFLDTHGLNDPPSFFWRLLVGGGGDLRQVLVDAHSGESRVTPKRPYY